MHIESNPEKLQLGTKDEVTTDKADAVFLDYAEVDFSTASSVRDVPALTKLQAVQGKKFRINMRVDNTMLGVFKLQTEMRAGVTKR